MHCNCLLFKKCNSMLEFSFANLGVRACFIAKVLVNLKVPVRLPIRDRRYRHKRQFFAAPCLFYCLAITQKPSTFPCWRIFVACRVWVNAIAWKFGISNHVLNSIDSRFVSILSVFQISSPTLPNTLHDLILHTAQLQCTIVTR